MALNDMFADMLKKAIPPEVAAMLTEEKLKEVAAAATAFVSEMRGRLEVIETTQGAILAKLERASNDNGSNSAGSASDKPDDSRSVGGSGD